MKPGHIALAVAIAVVAGCSHGTNPVSPAANSVGSSPPPAAKASDRASNHALWGWAELRCDTVAGEVELVPLRGAASHLNALKPLMAAMGMGVTLDPGHSDPLHGLFVMDISLTHPFPGKNAFSGFDVKGVLITPGTLVIGPLVLAGTGETELLNRDGLTRWWNPTEFTGGGLLGYSPGFPGTKDPALLTATVNPFKIFADALGPTGPSGDLVLPTLDDPTGRGVFTAGSTNTRRYEIQFPVSGGPVVVFNYAVDASWDLPDPNPPGDVPDDFPLKANQPEAFVVEITFLENTLEYLQGGAVSGELRIRVNVSDWQGIAAGNIRDEISIVRAFAPTLLTDGVTLDYVSETADRAVYEADLTPYLLPLDSVDPHLLLIRVGADGAGHYTQNDTTIGPAEPISAFQSDWVQVAEVACEPDDNNDFSTADSLGIGDSVSGTLCRPGGDLIDYRDFYYFDIPPGPVFGTLDLECLEEPTAVAIFDASQAKLAEEYVSGGSASIDIGSLSLTEGTYYIRVLTQNEQHMVHYDLHNNILLDPCTDPLVFSYETQVDVPEENRVSIGRRSIVLSNDDVWVVYAEGPYGAATVLCRHSPDGGGQTFDAPVQVNMMEIACQRECPSIARDNDGNLYCGWSDYAYGYSEPFVNMSADGGQSWTVEVSIYDFETAPLQENNQMRGIILAADDNGRLHALWRDRRVPSEPHLYYSYSDDHGATWQPAEKVDDSSTMVQDNDYAYDMDAAPDGLVACVWTDRRNYSSPPNTGLDIYSDTRDESTPFGIDVMVNPPQVDIGQYYPGVGISLHGVIHVAWVDRRNDGGYGGDNPINSWEPYYARSEDGGATYIAEQEIPTAQGYMNSSRLDLRVEVSPWGNPYVFYYFQNDDLFLSRSCDGGDTWPMPCTVFHDTYDSYFTQTICFDLATDGTVYALHSDSRNEPGPDYTHWNIFLGVSG